MRAGLAGPLADRDDRSGGQVLVLFALMVVVLLGAAAVAVDMGRFYSERRFLQNAADAAALAAGNALIRGATETEARAEALAVLARNYVSPPNGMTPAMPPGAGNEVYEPGQAGTASALVDGILIGGGDVRVAVRSTLPWTFGQALGFDDNVIGARARVRFEGELLPIAVRQYVNLPGDGSGLYPCTDNFNRFMDFFATADTACLGSESDSALRTQPNAGAAFDSANPDNDRANHGPIVAVLGQGSQPDNGADFRGFIALDIRNFSSASSQVYYNGVTSSTNANTLKDMQAAWIQQGGYPGPGFAAAVSPPDPNNQVATMDGNSTGIAVDALVQRFFPGDEILIAVYPGMVMEIPDFSMASPGTIDLPASGTVSNAGSFKVSRNQAFSGQVEIITVADANDPANPMVTGTLLGGADPITYTPNPVTPSLGSGQTVTMTNVSTSGASPGIYSLWLRGQAGSPYLTTKYQPFAIRIGTVNRDFTITSNQTEATAAAVGDTVSFTLNLRRSGSPFGAAVDLSIEGLPGSSLPDGIGAVSFSPSSVTPASGSGANSTLTINTGTMAPGQHRVVVRATGINSDGQVVTRLVPLIVSVATASSTGKQEYVDIVGFAVMRVARLTSNSVEAYAITPVIPDLSDPRLRRGQTARLAPWT